LTLCAPGGRIPAVDDFVKILPPGKRLAIFDRDATIISSRRVAYLCYLEVFREVISPRFPGLAAVAPDAYWREYHPFQPELFYRRNYPPLGEEELGEVRRISWTSYLDHVDDPEVNEPIPGMPEFVRDLAAAGMEIVILTAGKFNGEHLRRWDVPFQSFYSMVELREAGILQTKPEAIEHILSRHGANRKETVTVGDNPADHVPELTSVGVGFGLGSAEAREVLRRAVDHYADDLAELRLIFSHSARVDPTAAD